MDFIYEDINYILSALCYTSLEDKAELKKEAQRIHDKLDHRERITEKEVRWSEETKKRISENL